MNNEISQIEDRTVEVSLVEINDAERAVDPLIGQCAIVSVGACFQWSMK